MFANGNLWAKPFSRLGKLSQRVNVNGTSSNDFPFVFYVSGHRMSYDSGAWSRKMLLQDNFASPNPTLDETR